jgi:hypothetical protein
MKDEELETAIRAAGQLVVPDVAIRLPASKDEVSGNLCLSKDMKSLVFLQGEQRIGSTPITIHVSDIVKNPQTSEFGSKPMVLQITAMTGGDVEETFCFRFLHTEAALQAANNMRAKIVKTRKQ